MGTASLPLQPQPLCCFHGPHVPLSLSCAGRTTLSGRIFSAESSFQHQSPWVLGLAPGKVQTLPGVTMAALGWAGLVLALG